ncbi:DUF7716 domain-containing protein [Aliiroseovarius crassostreae]|uniref:DUF7716 domain-containing protein n=1 Tax=Aliiroseovarius crassostreae TaxID=154981 RepID=UPI003C7ECF95
MNQTTFGNVLRDLGGFDWKDWVYLEMQGGVLLSSPCILLNPDEAELAEDDFTPVAAEEAGMQEYLSVQDLRSIEQSLNAWYPDYSLDDLCSAATYYFENDAFMPPSNAV